MVSIDIYTRQQAADALRVTTKTLDRFRRDPAMNFPAPIVYGHKIFWDPADLKNWLESRKGVAPRAA